MTDMPQQSHEEVAERRAKLEALRQEGQAYPNDFKREHLAQALHDGFDSFEKETLESKKELVVIAGRTMTRG